MENLLTYFHRSFFILGLIAVFSCHRKHWYKKEFTQDEKITLSNQLWASESKHYYQGSVPEQFILDEALFHNPKNAAAWRERATAYLKRGLAKEAMYYYGKAVEYDSVSFQGLRGYMYLYLYRDYEKALADFNATDSLTPHFTDYPQGQSVDYMRGLCYYGLHDYNTALTYFDRYISEITLKNGEDWVDPYAFLYRGLAYEKIGNIESAIINFDAGLKAYPGLSDCLYHKSRLYYKSGDMENARSLIDEAKKSFLRGIFHQRSYVEVHDQIYIQDIEELERTILAALKEKPD